MRLTRCPLAHGDNDDRLCAWCGAEMPPRTHRWCSPECSRAYGENHYWTRARGAALHRDGYRCRRCADTEDLEVHHLEPVGRRGYGAGCQHHLDNLATLCHAHHAEEEAAMRARPGTATQMTLVA